MLGADQGLKPSTALLVFSAATPASRSFPKLVSCGEVRLADCDLRSFRQLGSSNRISHFRLGPNLCIYKVSP